MDLHTHLDTILDELRRTLAQLDADQAARFVEAICGASRIFIAGAGRSGLMMRAFAMRLMHLGYPVYVVGETVTPGIGKGDLLVIGSGSGATASLVGHAERAGSTGATVGLITIRPDTPIGRTAGILLTIPAPSPKIGQDAGLRSEQPMGSLFEQSLMLTLDALVLLLMEATGQDAAAMFGRHANLE
jgi:6-phospho-3-hexuloisomerase